MWQVYCRGLHVFLIYNHLPSWKGVPEQLLFMKVIVIRRDRKIQELKNALIQIRWRNMYIECPHTLMSKYSIVVLYT